MRITIPKKIVFFFKLFEWVLKIFFDISQSFIGYPLQNEIIEIECH